MTKQDKKQEWREKFEAVGKDIVERYSHYHCWNQGKNPACGQPKDKHEICCLCAIPRPLKPK